MCDMSSRISENNLANVQVELLRTSRGARVLLRTGGGSVRCSSR